MLENCHCFIWVNTVCPSCSKESFVKILNSGYCKSSNKRRPPPPPFQGKNVIKSPSSPTLFFTTKLMKDGPIDPVWFIHVLEVQFFFVFGCKTSHVMCLSFSTLHPSCVWKIIPSFVDSVGLKKQYFPLFGNSNKPSLKYPPPPSSQTCLK